MPSFSVERRAAGDIGLQMLTLGRPLAHVSVGLVYACGNHRLFYMGLTCWFESWFSKKSVAEVLADFRPRNSRAIKTAMLAVLLFVGGSVAAQGLLMRAGDSFAWAFSSMSYSSTIPRGGTANFNVFFTGDLFDSGEVLRLEMFENGMNESPVLASRVLGWPIAQSQLTLSSYDSLPPWQDRQGAIRVTVEQGSVRLVSVSVDTQMFTGKSRWAASQSVPEPTCSAFLLLGLFIAVVRKTRRGSG